MKRHYSVWIVEWRHRSMDTLKWSNWRPMSGIYERAKEVHRPSDTPDFEYRVRRYDRRER